MSRQPTPLSSPLLGSSSPAMGWISPPLSASSKFSSPLIDSHKHSRTPSTHSNLAWMPAKAGHKTSPSRVFRPLKAVPIKRPGALLAAGLALWLLYSCLPDAALAPFARGSSLGAELFAEHLGYLHYPAPARSSSAHTLAPRQGSALHPIAHLIASAEQRWDAMLASQSRTLADAVVEYRNRYGRNPPRGFDKWWAYATANGVILVDEYDQINSDIEPFLSLPADVLRNRSQVLIDGKAYIAPQSMFVVDIKNGAASLLPGPNTERSRAFDVVEGAKKIAQWLPDMQIPFTIEDGPGVVVSGEEKQAHVAVARQGRRMTKDELDALPALTDSTLLLWDTSCAPGSEMRRVFTGEGVGLAPAGVTVGSASSFIALDHLAAIDMCAHPEHRLQHGQTLGEGNARNELFPLVSSSKTAMHSDILTTPMEQFYMPTGDDPAWDNKQHNKLLWRGSSTGAWHGKGMAWRGSQRPRLVTMANAQAGERELLYADEAEGDRMRSTMVNEADVNARLFDIAYAGLPLQCNFIPGVDETCLHMKNQLRFEPHMSADEGNQYKYVLDVDGNAWSGRFRRLMMSSSAIFKSTIYPEWWTTRAVPWYHYVPIKVDYSDLHNAAAYFIGVDGVGAHDDAGRKIGQQGKEWAEKHWREEDMLAYQLRLFLELARAFNGDSGGSWDYQV